MLPGKSALEINGVGRLDGAVCGKLDGGAGYKGARRDWAKKWVLP